MNSDPDTIRLLASAVAATNVALKNLGHLYQMHVTDDLIRVAGVIRHLTGWRANVEPSKIPPWDAAIDATCHLWLALRGASAAPAWEPSAPLKVGDAVQLPDGARRRVTIPKNTPRSSPYEDPRMALPARGR